MSWLQNRRAWKTLEKAGVSKQALKEMKSDLKHGLKQAKQIRKDLRKLESPEYHRLIKVINEIADGSADASLKKKISVRLVEKAELSDKERSDLLSQLEGIYGASVSLESVVNADNIDVSDGKSIFITGQTGSGKSYLVHSMIKGLEAQYTHKQLKYALFDLKRIEFQHDGEDYHSQYLLFGVVDDSKLGIERLEYLARIAAMRLKMKENQPKIFIYIEECDMAVQSQQRFYSAVTAILESSVKTNMQLVYSTSRPSVQAVSKDLLGLFDRVLLGSMTSTIPQLGIDEGLTLPPYTFVEYPLK